MQLFQEPVATERNLVNKQEKGLGFLGVVPRVGWFLQFSLIKYTLENEHDYGKIKLLIKT